MGVITHACNSEDRVRKGVDKLIKMTNAKQQGRLDGFFTVQAKSDEKGKGPKPKVGTKRKVMCLAFVFSSLRGGE